jgi:hypothetical protein
MKKRLTTKGLLCAAAALLLAAGSANASVNTMQLLFTNLVGRATLTNFPVLVKLTPGNTANYSGFIDGTNGYDLRFWDNESMTGAPLNYEFESFDTNGTSCIWVQVPQLKQYSSIWASWGNLARSSQQASTINGVVWSEGYKAVFHMNQKDARDSSSYGYHGTGFGDTTTTTAQIGQGLTFDGIGDYVGLGAGTNALSALTSWSLEWWHKQAADHGAGGFLSVDPYNNPGTRLICANIANGLVYAGAWILGAGPYPEDSTWHHFVLSKSGSDWTLYKDGAVWRTATAAWTMGTTEMRFARHADGTNAKYWKGALDEIRAGSTPRSADWAWACWMNQSANHDAFVKYGVVRVRADELLTPVDVTAQSYYSNGGDSRASDRAINGSGMTPMSPVTIVSTATNVAANTMWLSSNTRDTWITFDFGEVKPLTGFHLWNYNEAVSGFMTRGIQTAGIYTGSSLPTNKTPYASCGAAWGTLVENMTFTKASGLTTYSGEDYFFRSPISARYLQIWVTGNFPGADAYTGLSEIRFYAPTGGLLWYDIATTNITPTTAWASATVSTNLTNAVLVWDTADKGADNINDWTYRVNLDAQSAGAVNRQLTGLAADSSYVWRFYGESGDANGWSAPATFVTSLTSAQKPVFTSAVPLSSTRLQLDWQDNAAYETGYVLQRSTTLGSGYSTIASLGANTTSYTDTGLTANTAYYYQLSATNAQTSTYTDFALCLTNATTTKPSLIKVVNTTSYRGPSGTIVSTNSFDAGATATKLIVSLASETAGAGPAIITYNGAVLTLAPGTIRNHHKGIFYLDNPYTGGAADLVVDMTGYSTVNGYGIGVVSLSGTVTGVVASASVTGLSISVTPTVKGSFVIAGFGSNGTSVSANPPLTQIYAREVGSAVGAAGYENWVDTAPVTYTFSSNDPESTAAAVFSPYIPPPGTMISFF